jgi:nitrate reductase NapE component
MEFFPKGLNPFKFQIIFNLVWIPEFLIQILLGIWTSSEKRSGSFRNHLSPCKVWKLLVITKTVFCIFKVGAFEFIWKIFLMVFGPVHLCCSAHGAALGHCSYWVEHTLAWNGLRPSAHLPERSSGARPRAPVSSRACARTHRTPPVTARERHLPP